ncbi:hypothetical protein AVEN_10409-1 [Araneus ventricosus]|uniref:Uncharacterized protein n=1 Tax=Araneus ventricosus TaxID=182803 RepID=A0A4Y2IZR0_ARAVE|nr:hypothetical protein AVEN_10409-1 [Araneus ventricosus]
MKAFLILSFFKRLVYYACAITEDDSPLCQRCHTRAPANCLSNLIIIYKKPAGVVSPKLSRILLEKGAVSPPLAWIKQFEPIVTQDPMTIRKYLGKKSNSKRCIPISTLSSLKDNPSACTDCYQVRMPMKNRMKKKRQAGVNKYRAQKIASKYACAWRHRTRWR